MRTNSWSSPYTFDPEPYAEQLLVLIRALEQQPRLDDRRLSRVLARHPKNGQGFFSKSELLRALRYLSERKLWHGDYHALVEKLQAKPVRSQSGVTPITVLTQPWPCPGRCIFCPNDPDMPKSYLSKEPGAQRALRHRFDPRAQTTARLTAIDQMGHCTDKIELILLGGTWSSYPRRYQLWFVKQLFETLNQFQPSIVAPQVEGSLRDFGAVPDFARSQAPLGVDEPWRLMSCETLKPALVEAQRQNERAHCRCVGLTVETRPDHVSEGEVVRIRQLGATRVQIGYQSLSDEVLQLNARGHAVAHSRQATELLRRAGFKIQAHWMANLYGSSLEKDLEDFARLFQDQSLRPDELKVYPCMLVQDTALEQKYRQGSWRPYTKQQLIELLTECLKLVPPYCRVNRVMRDIPGQDLIDGERLNGLRGAVETALSERGESSQNIRDREVRLRRLDREAFELKALGYQTSASEECFLQFVTEADDLAGFLRLSLPRQAAFIGELADAALIREVHVYGAAVPIGSRHANRPQHLGFGSELVRRAELEARARGFRRLSVISSVGTRAYYRALGFSDGELYQHKSLIDSG